MTGSSLAANNSKKHTYAQTGEYIIKITGTSGNYTLYNSN